MFRPTARRVLLQSAPRNVTRTAQTSRFLSTQPPHKLSRSWKNSALRWATAGGLVYYYNTSDLFAEEPSYKVYAPPETTSESETTASLEAVIAQREARKQAQLQAQQQASAQPAAEAAAPGSVGELEEEAGQQGAFNEETGEINWDCPCLGGMAHGPCGEQFRDAFSCFVYSQEEPKGVDCIDKFKTMQDCFRAHPDIYGSELEEDEVEDELLTPGEGDVRKEGEKVADGPATPKEAQGKTERAQAAAEQVKSDHGSQTSETEEAVPKAWHDSK